MNIAYLATPYTHSNPLVMEARYWAVTHAAGWLFRHGQPVFSPISHAHPIKEAAGLSTPWSEWAEYDLAVIKRLCSSVIVLTLDGWNESVGVTSEREFALKSGTPTSLMLPYECGLGRSFPYSVAIARRFNDLRSRCPSHYETLWKEACNEA